MLLMRAVGVPKLTFANADEIANQGFTAVSEQDKAHIHLFILLDCYHQSRHYKSFFSSIRNLLMHAADQFLPSEANIQSNFLSLLLLSPTHTLTNTDTHFEHAQTNGAHTHTYRHTNVHRHE